MEPHPCQQHRDDPDAQNLAVTVLYVPPSLDSGMKLDPCQQHRDDPDDQGGVQNPATASERTGDKCKEFKDFYLEAKARIWP